MRAGHSSAGSLTTRTGHLRRRRWSRQIGSLAVERERLIVQLLNINTGGGQGKKMRGFLNQTRKAIVVSVASSTSAQTSGGWSSLPAATRPRALACHGWKPLFEVFQPWWVHEDGSTQFTGPHTESCSHSARTGGCNAGSVTV